MSYAIDADMYIASEEVCIKMTTNTSTCLPFTGLI
jgi:hypothetical protein